ncbi:MAG TPA: beta-galactosidase, partial [Candidatus Saccharimonadales bacterium]|nr:beta-galactosidase [Candidatus Saccharimonadales bacterium]
MVANKIRSKGSGGLFWTLWQRVWYRGLWRRIWYCILAAVILWTGLMYGVAEWYIHKHNSEPLVLGSSFVPDYAQSLGVDPQQTFTAMLSDLKLKQVRLVSYWSDIEPTPGRFDFSMLDWEFAQADKYGTKISLSIGLRQPRWPECHPPGWVDTSKAEK